MADLGVLIVRVTSGERETVPHGGTRPQVKDGLPVAANDESIQKFRALMKSPQFEAQKTQTTQRRIRRVMRQVLEDTESG